MKCPQEVPPHYKACYYTLLGSESGPLCALPDNIVYTKQTDGTHGCTLMSFTEFDCLWLIQVLETWIVKKTITSVSGGRGESEVQFETTFICRFFEFLSPFACCVPVFDINLYYYHNIILTPSFSLLKGACCAFIISICWLIFMHTTAPFLFCFDWLSQVKMPKHIFIWIVVSRGAVLQFPHIVVIYTS